jgi:hypothetical protein
MPANATSSGAAYIIMSVSRLRFIMVAYYSASLFRALSEDLVQTRLVKFSPSGLPVE